MTHIQKLDAVLAFFADRGHQLNDCFKGDEFVGGVLEMFPELKTDPTINNDIGRCIGQLQDDRYIEVIKVTIGLDKETKHNAGLISLKGLLFFENGGYTGAKISLDAERLLMKNLALQADRNAKNLNYLTLFLGIATTALVLFEIYRFLFEHKIVFVCP